MITYANEHTAPQICQMWKTVFGDSDAYIDLYFREKYKNEQTLLYEENGKVVASLQMLPYQFTFCQMEIPIAYISGAGTLPEARKKGYMQQLLIRSFDEMAKNRVSLSILVPQENWLLYFYEKYGYAQTFDEGSSQQVDLRTLLELNNGDEKAAFRKFDALFRSKDMTVQKTFNDFRVIVEEAQLFNFPPKTNLNGMARIINAETLLSIFAKKYNHLRFSVQLFDPIIEINNATFTIDKGNVEKNALLLEPVIEIEIRKLTQLLFGYHTSKEKTPLRCLFPEKVPQMNFMLE